MGAATSIFFVITFLMFVAVVIIFDVWFYVLVVYAITLLGLGVSYFAHGSEPPRRGVRQGSTRRRPIQHYSSKMERRIDPRREREEREMRRFVEKKFDEASSFDDAESLR